VLTSKQNLETLDIFLLAPFARPATLPAFESPVHIPTPLSDYSLPHFPIPSEVEHCRPQLPDWNAPFKAANVHLIKTNFKPKLKANKQFKYNKMDKKQRFEATENERLNTEAVIAPKNLVDFETKVCFYSHVLSILITQVV
jgi:hypothetical protein